MTNDEPSSSSSQPSEQQLTAPSFVIEYIQRLNDEIQCRTNELRRMVRYQKKMHHKYRRTKLVCYLCCLNNMNQYIDEKINKLQCYEDELTAVRTAMPTRFVTIKDHRRASSSSSSEAATASSTKVSTIKQRMKIKSTEEVLTTWQREKKRKMNAERRRQQSDGVTDEMSPLAACSPPPSNGTLVRMRSFFCMTLWCNL